MNKKKPYFSKAKYMKDMKERKFDVFNEKFLNYVTDTDGNEWFDDINNLEVYRPFVLFGAFKTKNKNTRNFKLFKEWIEWR
jgi:hypothetical protein